VNCRGTPQPTRLRGGRLRLATAALSSPLFSSLRTSLNQLNITITR